MRLHQFFHQSYGYPLLYILPTSYTFQFLAAPTRKLVPLNRFSSNRDQNTMTFNKSTMLQLAIACLLISVSYSTTIPRYPFIKLPRGGALFDFFRGKSASQRYQYSLEEQVSLLERQLRTAKDEATQLRKLLKLASQTSRRQAVNQTREEQAIFQAELSALLAQLAKMESLKKELELLLEEEQKRVVELEKLLKGEKANVQELIEKHEAEIKELQKALNMKMQKQIDELQKTMGTKIKDATNHARTEALKQLDEKIKDAVEKVQTKAERDLELERQKSLEAVERERVKMRKLVKALAEREKKVFTNHEQQQQRGTMISGKSSLASNMKQTGTNSVRSPIK
jgi:NADH dehydrogenase/NADH:ubiquinone oxidoreductase subunit G